MKVLFIGGTGLISTAVTNELKRMVDLTILNRGTTIVEGTKHMACDINDRRKVKDLIKDEYYDVVVNWIAFSREDVERDYELFYGRTKQYVFISSASAYEKPVNDYPVTEKTILRNPYWEYSRNKILCEDFLNSAHSEDFNVTIIRPSHTYDDTKLILPLKENGKEYTLLKRIMDRKQVIIPDAGTSLWTVTHNSDFAKGFIPVLGNEKTYGEDYHITSNIYYTWEQFYEMACKTLCVEPNPVHIPTDFILRYMPEKEGELLGDKHWSMIFDNSKIKEISTEFNCTTKYSTVMPKVIESLLNDKDLQIFDKKLDDLYQKIIDEYIKMTA